MSTTKANLRFLVESSNCENTIAVITNSPGVIQDIENAIDAFSRRHKDLKIFKYDNRSFRLSPKAYIAIQNVIYEYIK